MLSQNFMLEKDPLSLERIRSALVRLEDTIIFDLIERAQFAHNPRMYVHCAFPELKELGFDGSWLEWFLKETETFHGVSPFPSANHAPSLILSRDYYPQPKREDTPGRASSLSPRFPTRITTRMPVRTNIHSRTTFPTPF
ncbi:hypothetical protein JVT61DRAFT_1207 [Boletus reticuloceps]|uniref:chorismate mutase n=1 Tax=Boletus reticuloceps TaxID=495285 RepID=A0A8I2YRH6_9AGAM|nr:hypothetical protein JVT61DRAFT_1207 [Boletus reticuloceps]